MGRITVVTPATSANLGPGYDSFGLALGIFNRFSAQFAEEWSVEVTGTEIGDLPGDASNPVALAMARAFAEAGCEGRSARVRCENGIPTGRGLGSSAAAIVGGLMLGFALAGAKVEESRLIALASEIEGHPDNVAAAVLGGFTICDVRDGLPVAHRIPVARGLAAVVAVSHSAFKTTTARRLLPAQVPLRDAAANSAHAAMLVAGLMSGDSELIAAGAVDRLHEASRASSLPGFEQTRAALLEAGATAAVLSGAGPTVLGLVYGDDREGALGRAREIASAATPAIEATGSYLAPMVVPVDDAGAHLAEMPV